MRVPTFLNVPIVDEHGMPTTHFRQVMDQLLTQLQANFSDEGLGVPDISAEIADELSNSRNGTLVYVTHGDPTQSGFYGVVNGTYKKLATT